MRRLSSLSLSTTRSTPIAATIVCVPSASAPTPPIRALHHHARARATPTVAPAAATTSICTPLWRQHGIIPSPQTIGRSLSAFTAATATTPKASSSSSSAASLQNMKNTPTFHAGSVMKASDNDIFRNVEFPVGTTPDNKHENAAWRKTINQLFVKHKPSNHTFFATLANAPSDIIRNRGFLNELYHRYQSAMHATRAAVYNAPYLNAPTLRQRKIDILADDDAIGGISHHMHLHNMFTNFGATPRDQDTYGDLQPLAASLDPQTAAFVRRADELYRLTTGAWCIAEVLSDDWLSSLANSLKPHFPTVMQEPYFDEVFSGHVEIVHMLETVALTEDILSRYPHLLAATQEHATIMAAQLDDLWTNLEGLVKNPSPYLTK